MRDVDATDPTKLAACIRQRTLVVQGGNDGSVPRHHGEVLRDALLSRPEGESLTEYLFVPDVTHMFKLVPPGVTGVELFGYPGETDVRVADGIDRWIRQTQEQSISP
jgi:pimeloyl-ACP methyl ester carboxylesterase